MDISKYSKYNNNKRKIQLQRRTKIDTWTGKLSHNHSSIYLKKKKKKTHSKFIPVRE